MHSAKLCVLGRPAKQQNTYTVASPYLVAPVQLKLQERLLQDMMCAQLADNTALADV